MTSSSGKVSKRSRSRHGLDASTFQRGSGAPSSTHVSSKAISMAGSFSGRHGAFVIQMADRLNQQALRQVTTHNGGSIFATHFPASSAIRGRAQPPPHAGGNDIRNSAFPRSAEPVRGRTGPAHTKTGRCHRQPTSWPASENLRAPAPRTSFSCIELRCPRPSHRCGSCPPKRRICGQS